MPTGDYDSKPSWADQVEEEGDDDKCITSELLKDIPLSGVLSGGAPSGGAPSGGAPSGGAPSGGVVSGGRTADPDLVKGEPLPSPKELVNGNIKTVTEYREEEDGNKVKIIRTFRIETRKASKAVARRKNWKKFGKSEFDAPGPNVATTTVSDDVFMTFITSKEGFRMLRGGGGAGARAPPLARAAPLVPAEPEPVQAQQSKTGKYVPPSLRDGASRRGESMQPNRRAISRIYLAKDKTTGQSKGFAFISFHRREDAARAIAGVSGFGYDHLILNVEWAKPSTN
ncbi:PREDICTED: eukaryotic translation initiation factor 3 subunit G [Gekko japonicus]|uniref:Eukaryotic translation initiation factor 3 subunit G n=1 Tax=Gekko japonicus TaxID=146911 RepID=A0ABM1KUA1_GEKJA|nr:PREDICTED: eukaryotic translation initiation factor 3 subunit G [Gekko japonicus]